MLLRNRWITLLIVLIVAGAAAWWLWVARGPEVSADAPTRGTAVEIVYGTGAVEPIRWAKGASGNSRFA